MLVETFKAKVDRFLKTSGMAASDLGRKAINNGNFVQRLREGCDFRLSTAQRVLDFMKKHKREKSS